MTAFSPDWLALRESADRRARNRALRDEVVAFLASRAEPQILDLACGTGSNLRALAPCLNARQHWRLIDNDPCLLDVARATIASQTADDSRPGATLHMFRGGYELDLSLQCCDLRALDNIFDAHIDLVTSAAFFDLTSQRWIDDFCDALAARKLPLYAVLTYSGDERWSPPHPADASMLAAFHAHQRHDKGFGPAAGPHAVRVLAKSLRARGYRVLQGDSPWMLDHADDRLIRELAEGSADAVAQTGLVDPGVVEDWRQSRTRATTCKVDHVDIFATPVSASR